MRFCAGPVNLPDVSKFARLLGILAAGGRFARDFKAATARSKDGLGNGGTPCLQRHALSPDLGFGGKLRKKGSGQAGRMTTKIPARAKQIRSRPWAFSRRSLSHAFATSS